MSSKYSSIISTILNKTPIVDFLSKNGIEYSYQNKDRYVYSCPFHPEKNPSFMVYANTGEPQSFYCFSCKCGGNIINLYAKLKHVEKYEALRVLSEGINLTDSNILNSIIGDMNKETEEKILEKTSDLIADISFQISCLGYEHLKAVNYDKEEIQFLEKLYKKIDEIIWKEDCISLLQIYKYIMDGEDGITPFYYRINKYMEIKGQ